MNSSAYNTKMKIVSAFNELLRDNNFSKITVSSIVSLANISRTTFYRHFKDKYDIIHWFHSQNNMISHLVFQENRGLKECLYYGLLVIQKHRHIYIQVLDYVGQNSFHNYYTQLIEEGCKNFIGEENLSKEILIAIKVYAYGITYVICDWIKNEIDESPEELASFLSTALPNALCKYYF
ncbi:MAG: TetR/AcrR family transcriptional regulator C-terminal domain-containing protein [Saccharofermentanales bacterium]|jgi:hypothetical protein